MIWIDIELITCFYFKRYELGGYSFIIKHVIKSDIGEVYRNIMSRSDKSMEKNKKQVYLEVLRIFAIFFVIYNHTRDQGFYLYATLNDYSFQYFLSLVLSLVCKCAVPIFFMISGAVLLGKEESVKDLFVKRILRLVIIDVIFVFLQYLRLVRIAGFSSFDISDYLHYLYSEDIIEQYWYIKAYFAYLLMLPILRLIVKNAKKEHYHYLIGLNIAFIIVAVIYIFTGHNFNVYVQIRTNTILYPLIGYYLANVAEIERSKKNYELVIGSLLGLIIIGCGIQLYYYGVHQEYTDYVSNVTTDLFAMVFFILARMLIRNESLGEKTSKILCIVGSGTFGAYLMEDIVRGMIDGICTKMNVVMPMMLSCFIFVLLSMMIAISITLIINKVLELCHIPFRI